MNKNIVCGNSLELLNEQKYLDMKFDVIIGNPPYQLSDGGGGKGSSAKPLYHKFIQQAKKINPKYISMIIPARWYTGGKGLDEFRMEMLNDKRIEKLIDFTDSKDCFPQNDIKGGICYFLWNKNHFDDCTITTISNNKTTSTYRPLLEDGCDVFIRFTEALSIVQKIKTINNLSMSGCVSSRKPFGIPSNFKGESQPSKEKDITLYGNKSITYVSKKELNNVELIDKYKVIAPKAYGKGEIQSDWIKPITAPPGTACTETYLVLNSFDNESEMLNFLEFTQTNFFNFLLGLKKITQNNSKSKFEFIPVEDFSVKWTDELLYAKYNLNQDEIDFIESIYQNKTNS